MIHNCDFTGTVIREGDWLIMRGTSSHMPPLRFAKVLGFGSTNKPRVGVFEIQPDSNYEWSRFPIKPITLNTAQNSWIVHSDMLPESLKKYIAEELHGDTEYRDKQIKANKVATVA